MNVIIADPRAKYTKNLHDISLTRKNKSPSYIIDRRDLLTLVVEPVGVCTKYYVLLVHILEKFSRAIEEAGEESK